MRTVGFVGKSGSGKSYRVTEVAKENGISFMIDDGLLISGNRAVAGISAKGEKTKYASVKRALFFSKAHAQEVMRAIKKENAESILIVGTSVDMVEKIAEALHLPKPEKIIYITDVATEEEIETAQKIRRTEGKHVIPVPTFEIRKDFSGYWLDPLQIFRTPTRREESEKTLIRPTYSYFGDFTIAHGVLVTIGAKETRSFKEVSKIWTCGAEEVGRNVIFHLELNLWYGTDIPKVTEKIRKRVADTVNEMTAILVEDVIITVKSLDIRQESRKKSLTK